MPLDNYRVALVNAQQAQILNAPTTYVSSSSIDESFGSGHLYSPHVTQISNAQTVHTLTGSEIGEETEHVTSSMNLSTSTNATDSLYISGSNDGSYDNPNSVLGDSLDVSTSVSLTGSIYSSVNGSITGTTTGTNYNNYSGTSSYSGSSTTTGTSQEFIEIRPNSRIDISSWNQICMVFCFNINSYSPDTPLFLVNNYTAKCMFHRDSGLNTSFNCAGNAMCVSYGSNSARVSPSTSGRYFPSIQYNTVYIVVALTNVIGGQYDSVLISFDPKLYRDLGYEYNQNTSHSISNQTDTLGTDIEGQTTAIGQQTQNQTNQLKDTTGSNTVLDGATDAGNNIKNNVTFASQLEGVGTQLATLVASATPSEAGFTIPSWEFQGNQIWPSMTVSVWENIPIDIKSRVRLFNTVIFAILWLRSLWNWIASIFGFEQIDDSGGSFDDLFDEDEYNAYDSHSVPSEYFGPKVARRVPGYRGRRKG